MVRVLTRLAVLANNRHTRTHTTSNQRYARFRHTPDPHSINACVRVAGRRQLWDTPGNAAALESLGDRNLAADGCMLVYSVLMKRTIKCLEERLNAYR